jgi:hypothetical protein
MPTQASRRLRQAQAGPGRPGSLRQPSGSPQDGSGTRPYGAARSGTLIARTRSGTPAAAQARPGTLSAAQARLSTPGGSDTLRRAQEGADIKKAQTRSRRHPGHAQARSGRRRTAQARLACSTTAQARSGRFRQAQTRLRNLSDRLRYAQVSSRHCPAPQARSLRQAQDGTTTNTLRLSRHAQEGSNSRLRHPQAQAGGQAGSSGQSGRLE